MTDISRSKSTKDSRISGTLPIEAQAPSKPPAVTLRKTQLALAVIAHAPGLQDAAAAEGLQAHGEIAVVVDWQELRRRNPDAVEEGLFGEAVLGHFERPRRRVDRHALGEMSGGNHRHVLEFVGDDRADAGQFVERCRVVIGGDDLAIGNLRCRTIGLRLQHHGLVAEAGCGHGQHPAELAAADDADGRVEGQAGGHASSVGCSATLAVWAARQASRRVGQRLVGKRQHRGREQGGIGRAGLADGERSDGNAGRHLDDGKQRILARQRLRFDRHAEHRQRGHRRGHAGKVGRTAGAGDDDA